MKPNERMLFYIISYEVEEGITNPVHDNLSWLGDMRPPDITIPNGALNLIPASDLQYDQLELTTYNTGYYEAMMRIRHACR